MVNIHSNKVIILYFLVASILDTVTTVAGVSFKGLVELIPFTQEIMKQLGIYYWIVLIPLQVIIYSALFFAFRCFEFELLKFIKSDGESRLEFYLNRITRVFIRGVFLILKLAVLAAPAAVVINNTLNLIK